MRIGAGLTHKRFLTNPFWINMKFANIFCQCLVFKTFALYSEFDHHLRVYVIYDMLSYTIKLTVDNLLSEKRTHHFHIRFQTEFLSVKNLLNYMK